MFNIMNKLKYLLALPVALMILMTPVAVYASTQSDLKATCAEASKNGGSPPAYCSSVNNQKDPLTGPNGIFTKTITFLAFLGGVVAVFVIIFAGGIFVMSRGDAAKIVKAKTTIMYALVGLIVIIFARQLVVFILSRI